MYAVFESGGKQYRVTEGDVVFLERLGAEPGETVRFDKLLACSNETETDFGKPFLDDASVEAKVLGHGKSKKIVVFKYKAKKQYRKKQGHRQPYTKVRIESIVSAKLGTAAYIGGQGLDAGFDADVDDVNANMDVGTGAEVDAEATAETNGAGVGSAVGIADSVENAVDAADAADGGADEADGGAENADS